MFTRTAPDLFWALATQGKKAKGSWLASMKIGLGWAKRNCSLLAELPQAAVDLFPCVDLATQHPQKWKPSAKWAADSATRRRAATRDARKKEAAIIKELRERRRRPEQKSKEKGRSCRGVRDMSGLRSAVQDGSGLPHTSGEEARKEEQVPLESCRHETSQSCRTPLETLCT